MRQLEKDLEKLADAFYEALHIHNCEYGGIGLDSKRPFGNSDVEGDILVILGQEPEGDDGDSACWSSNQREYATELYHVHLIPYLVAQWKRSHGSASENTTDR